MKRAMCHILLLTFLSRKGETSQREKREGCCTLGHPGWRKNVVSSEKSPGGFLGRVGGVSGRREGIGLSICQKAGSNSQGSVLEELQEDQVFLSKGRRRTIQKG